MTDGILGTGYCQYSIPLAGLTAVILCGHVMQSIVVLRQALPDLVGHPGNRPAPGTDTGGKIDPAIPGYSKCLGSLAQLAAVDQGHDGIPPANHETVAMMTTQSTRARWSSANVLSISAGATSAPQ